MVTAVCNVYINSLEKLGLFKEALSRVCNVSDNWLVYVRGSYRREAVDFVMEQFNQNSEALIVFDNLVDGHWARSTLKMLEKARYDRVYVFLEDHLLLRTAEDFKKAVEDMAGQKIDCFSYSFFNVGIGVNSVELFYPDESAELFSFHVDKSNIQLLKEYNPKFYPFSLASVLSLELFRKILEVETRHRLLKVPFWLQVAMEEVVFRYPRNRSFWARINKYSQALGFRCVIYPKATPFNLERSLFDVEEELLPFEVGVLKRELFANWDDDNIVSGSSLLKRGLYPVKLKAGDGKLCDEVGGTECFLKKGMVISKRYYPELSRLPGVPRKIIKVRKGMLRVFGMKEEYELRAGDAIEIYSNIPHNVTALEDVSYYYILKPDERS